MSNKRGLRSENGSVILSALVISAIIAVFGGVIASRISSANDLTQLPRIRAAMAQIEIQTRLAAYSASSYTCTYSTGNQGHDCDIQKPVFDKLTADVGEGLITVTIPSPPKLRSPDNHFIAQINYAPKSGSSGRMAVATRVIDVEIPSEILQPVNFLCPDSAPLFVGYSDGNDGQKKGSARCRAIPATACAAGQYISSINAVTLEPTCQAAGRRVACEPHQYLGTFTWNNGSTITSQCIDRKNPIADMLWNPSTLTTFDASYFSQDPDTPDPVPPPLPTPEVISWSAPNPQPASGCYTPPPVNCIGAFSACSQTCGGGSQSYLITTPASNGGAACPYTNGYVMQCNMQACPAATPAPSGSGCYWNQLSSIQQGSSGNPYSRCTGGWDGNPYFQPDAAKCIATNAGQTTTCREDSNLNNYRCDCPAAPPAPTPAPTPAPAATPIPNCWIRITVTAGGPPMYDSQNWDADERGYIAQCPVYSRGPLQGIFLCNQSNNNENSGGCGPDTDGTQGMKGSMRCMCP